MALNPEERRHSELRQAIDRIAEKAATKAGRRAARRAAGGYFALLFVLFIGAFIYQRQIDARIGNAVHGVCERVNTLRIQEANRTAQVIWAALESSKERSEKLAKTARPDEAKTHRQAVRQIDVYAAAMRWTPQTNCREARAHPDTYTPPAPRPFTKRFLNLKVVPK